MLGIDPRAARYTWTAVLVVLLLCLIYLVRTTLVIFILAILFAYLLSPLVNLLDRFLPASRTRAPALALAYLIFVGLLVLLVVQVGSRVIEQAHLLSQKFPEMIAKWEAPSPNASPAINSMKQQIVERLRATIASRSADILSMVGQAGMKFMTVATDVVHIVIIPILAFFFLKDGHVMRRHLLEMVEDGPHRALIDDLMADLHLLLAHYMRALVLISATTFVTFAIFFSILRVPFAVLLAATGAVLEFIPFIGPLTAGILILIVGAVSGAAVLPILIFLLVYRLFLDYVFSPHLMGQGVQLHPLLVLFGVFAGAEVAGVAGAFLSVPLLATARIVYLRIRKAKLRSRLSPAETGTVEV
jgi:predicted PurR-regulated permease PerM